MARSRNYPMLNKKTTIVVREPGATAHLALQNDQLMAEHRVLSFKPALRLEWGPKSQERNVVARSFRQFRRFLHLINADKVFGTHSHIRLGFPAHQHAHRGLRGIVRPP